MWYKKKLEEDAPYIELQSEYVLSPHHPTGTSAPWVVEMLSGTVPMLTNKIHDRQRRGPSSVPCLVVSVLSVSLLLLLLELLLLLLLLLELLPLLLPLPPLLLLLLELLLLSSRTPRYAER